MTVRLISSVLVDVGEFPLHLPVPTVDNGGGYLLPTGYSYSPIDLLVAGLEAVRLNKQVYNLAQFFDTYRAMLSMSKICLTVQYNEQVIHESIFCLRVMCLENDKLLTVMRKNAPLSFKWGIK